jgi:hypothetical protein
MSIEELKSEKSKLEQFLKDMRGCGSSLLAKNMRKKAKERIEKIENQIWKIENPESWKNHYEALKGFVDSGCYNSMFVK